MSGPSHSRQCTGDRWRPTVATAIGTVRGLWCTLKEFQCSLYEVSTPKSAFFSNDLKMYSAGSSRLVAPDAQSSGLCSCQSGMHVVATEQKVPSKIGMAGLWRAT